MVEMVVLGHLLQMHFLDQQPQVMVHQDQQVLQDILLVAVVAELKVLLLFQEV
tara:strand:+ start:327 stop:485 length:159 start_codon:yes stop_codon:yes gene_type:complete